MPVFDGLDALLNCLRATLFCQVNLVILTSFGLSLMVNNNITLFILLNGVFNTLYFNCFLWGHVVSLPFSQAHLHIHARLDETFVLLLGGLGLSLLYP